MSKVLKYVLITIGSLLILLFIGVKVILEPLIEKKARSFIENTDSKFYTYNFEDLKLNVFAGWIRIQGVKAIPGEHAFDSLKAGIYDDLDQIVASDVFVSMSYFAYLKDRKVEIDEIRIVEPEITVFHSGKVSEKKNDPASVQDIFSDSFQGFSLKKLSFESVKLVYQDINKDGPDIELSNMAVDIRNVILNSQTLDSAAAGFVFDFIKISSGGLKIAMNDYYHLEVQQIDVVIEKDTTGNFKGTDVEVGGISYAPNDLALKEIQNGQIRNLTEVTSDKITLKRLKISEWLFNKKLVIEEFVFESPTIKYLVNSKMSKKSKENPSTLVVKDIFKEINIGKFELGGGQMVISDVHKSAADLSLEEVAISFENLLLNETTTAYPIGFSYSHGTFRSSKATSDLGQYYNLAIGDIAVDFSDASIVVKDIQMLPKQSREEYSKIIPYEQDQYTLHIAQIALNKLDLAELSENLGIKLQSVVVRNPNFNVYRDKWVQDQEFVYKPLPSSAIRNLAFPLWIDSLRIENGSVSYEQLGDVVEYEDELPGEVTFSNLSATSLRVTNHKDALAKNPILKINAEALFMNDGKLIAEYALVIPDTMDVLYIKAELDSFHTASLDPMIKNLLLVEIPDGFISRMKVDMVGNDTLITGTVAMEYTNLNVNLLKTKNPKKSSGFLNTVANGVIRKNNTRDKGKFIIGIVNFDRFRNKSVFNYSWKGIMTGMISTAVPFTKKEKVKRKNRDSKKK